MSIKRRSNELHIIRNSTYIEKKQTTNLLKDKGLHCFLRKDVYLYELLFRKGLDPDLSNIRVINITKTTPPLEDLLTVKTLPMLRKEFDHNSKPNKTFYNQRLIKSSIHKNISKSNKAVTLSSNFFLTNSVNHMSTTSVFRRFNETGISSNYNERPNLFNVKNKINLLNKRNFAKLNPHYN